jgi:hypothetical protein
VAAGIVAAAAVIGVTWWLVGSLSGAPVPVKQAGAAVLPSTSQPSAAVASPAAKPDAPMVFAPTTVSQPASAQLPTKVITVEKPVVLKPAPAGEPKATAPVAPPNPALALAEAHRLLGKAHEASVAERYAEAEDLYNRVRATGLERGAALTGLAEVAFQRGQYPEAVRVGNRAVEAGGGNAAKMVLGNSYFKLGKYDDAILQYREVLRADAGHREARANLAAAEKRKGG